MSSNKTVEEFLTEEIEKSGYPLEIEVSSIINSSGNWMVYNQDYYFDSEQNEGRTIDIYSEYGMFPNIEPFGVKTDMVIECKKSNTHAWVFFTIPEDFRLPIFDGQTFEFLKALTNETHSIMDWIVNPSRVMDIESFLHYDRFKRIAIVYDEIKLSSKRQKKGKKEIFEAINQIVKYISYDFGKLREHVKKSTHHRGFSTDRLLYFYFPVIVFDGKMYECIVEKNVPKLLKRNHILLRTYYRPEYSDSALSFGIDIVRRNYFPIFQKEIENDIHLIAERISSRQDKLKKFTEEVLEKMK